MGSGFVIDRDALKGKYAYRRFLNEIGHRHYQARLEAEFGAMFPRQTWFVRATRVCASLA
jgi:hypothetical protein